MKRAFVPLHVAFCVVFALLAACAPNPADEKTEAVVEEAEPETKTLAVENAEVYRIDPEDSKIEWVGSKVTGSHDGGFENFEGTIEVVGGEPEGATVDLTIDTTSIYSDNDDLTGHLKSPDFFEVETYPTATFKSTSISAGENEGEYSVTGNLTLHGVTKRITFPATIDVDDDEVEANAEFVIKRYDFDVEYPGKPDDLIRDEVVIKFDIDAESEDGDDAIDEADEMLDEADEAL